MNVIFRELSTRAIIESDDRQKSQRTTGLIVGYPPCPYISTIKGFLEARHDVKVVAGTHPIPKKYLDTYTHLGTWDDPGDR
jgi:hypothetical protein